jgi:hypothetical protein
MYVLIEASFNQNLLGPSPFNPKPEDLQEIISSFAENVESNTDKLLGPGAFAKNAYEGFAIANVDSMEEAWGLVMGNPMFPYLNIELWALTDMVKVQQELSSRALDRLRST